MKRVLKWFAVVYCAMGLIVYTSCLFEVLTTADQNAKSTIPVFVILDVLMILFLYLLLRKKKNQTPPLQVETHASKYTLHAPPDILRDMRKHYTVIQARDDSRIMADSFTLIQQTTNFETFFSRLELAQKKALTLLQAEKAGCKGIKQLQTTKACESVLDNVQNAKMVFLDNSYTKETDSAMQLKTAAGRCKRLTAYLGVLREYEDQFLDVEEVYAGVVAKVEALISENQTDSKQKTIAQSSSADEIMKFKQLLDAGAITEAEYNAKKKQLLEQ